MSSGTLPFTGSVLSLPIAALGAVLTLGGFVLRKVTRAEA